jgi:hypothetical protein
MSVVPNQHMIYNAQAIGGHISGVSCIENDAGNREI